MTLTAHATAINPTSIVRKATFNVPVASFATSTSTTDALVVAKTRELMALTDAQKSKLSKLARLFSRKGGVAPATAYRESMIDCGWEILTGNIRGSVFTWLSMEIVRRVVLG